MSVVTCWRGCRTPARPTLAGCACLGRCSKPTAGSGFVSSHTWCSPARNVASGSVSGAPLNRRFDWLAGRIVAKDAVRLRLKPQLGLLRPADIEIYVDQNGRPRVRGPWHKAGRLPHVTIAHSGGEALAIAIDGDACDGIGVDIEQVGRVDQVVYDAALTDHERRWIAAIDEGERPEWATRFWCAKEAVGKALGCGLPNAGQDLEVCAVEPGRGMLTVALRGALEQERPDLQGRRIVTCTTSVGTTVTAAAVV